MEKKKKLALFYFFLRKMTLLHNAPTERKEELVFQEDFVVRKFHENSIDNIFKYFFHRKSD